MKSLYKVKTLTAMIGVVAVLASCGRGETENTSNSQDTEIVQSTVPPSTTVPWTKGAEVEAWEQFLQSYEVLDASLVSTGECGSRAMLVTEGSLTTYWWDGVQWNDDSQLLEGGRGLLPQKVYTHDYTNDGVLDFFVLYADEQRPRTQTFGAYFAYLWGAEDVCNWGWVDINNGRITTKTLQSPDVDVQNGSIFAPGFTQRRTSARGVYEFLPSTGAFVYRELTKK